MSCAGILLEFKTKLQIPAALPRAHAHTLLFRAVLMLAQEGETIRSVSTMSSAAAVDVRMIVTGVNIFVPMSAIDGLTSTS